MKVALVAFLILGSLALVSVSCDRSRNRSIQPEVLN